MSVPVTAPASPATAPASPATAPASPATAPASPATAPASPATAPASPATAPASPGSAAPASSRAPRVAIVTLGCGRNEVDSDQLAGLFHREGMPVVDDAGDADVVLVNTCTFIAPAKQESIDTVLAACDLKQTGARAVLIVGCMAERYPDELAAEIPEADAVVGFDGYARLPRLVSDILEGRAFERVTKRPVRPVHPLMPGGSGATRRAPLPLMVAPTEAPPEAGPAARGATPQDALDRFGSDTATSDAPASGPRFPVRRFDGDRSWAYLKIASGCDRVCTFCAIPQFRGSFRSRPVEEIVAEARFLASRGARELVLVSENTTSYGKDLGGRHRAVELLEQLDGLDELHRVRLMYLQPDELQRPLVEAIAGLDKVASYYDISMQHVSEPVVTRMARSGSVERYSQLIAGIRDADPDAVFRSNFILGFPGETEADVVALEEFLEANRLDWVGLFTFSPEDGTPSAHLDDQVPEELARERLQQVQQLQERLADETTEAFVGRRLDVLVDDTLPGAHCIARSYREAPETDGEITLETADGQAVELPRGRLVTATVTRSVGVDLIAVPDHS